METGKKVWDYAENYEKLPIGTKVLVIGASSDAIKYGMNLEGNASDGTIFYVDRSNGYVLSGRDRDNQKQCVDTRSVNVSIVDSSTFF